jgi:GntR family transcriptional repressor for pyruvate dehydrogenase complex
MAETLKPDFEVIRKNKVYEAVARQLEQLILEKLKPGDKLPPERELCDMFAVSRSSVRDAIRSLELMGLLEPRQGMGTVVRELTADSLINPLANVLSHKKQLVTELFDVRQIIEPSLAARAAQHATGEEIAEMEAILRRQAEKMQKGKAAIEEDTEFHYVIALSSGNSIVLKVLDVLMDLLRATRERSLQVTGRPQKSLAGHRKILAAIKRKDPEAAEAAMRRHINDVEEIVLKTLSKSQ